MSFKQPLPTVLKIGFVLVTVTLFSGCAQKPLPPVFNLYGYQRLAVVPFNNQTQDPALASAQQDEMTDEILNRGCSRDRRKASRGLPSKRGSQRLFRPNGSGSPEP